MRVTTNNAKRFSDAKKERNDEFYTPKDVIVDELEKHADRFKNSFIYCPCDDYRTSNFVKVLVENFDRFKITLLIATSYNKNGKGICFKRDPSGKHIEYELEGDGDFRGEECEVHFRVADIVITNPPFSLIRPLVRRIGNRDFILIGPETFLADRDIILRLGAGEIYASTGIMNNGVWFDVPDEYSDFASNCKRTIDGKLQVRITGCRWITTFPIDKPFLETGKQYIGNESFYPYLDGTDIINVDSYKDVPMDYTGIIAAPISVITRININQFEVIGRAGSSTGLKRVAINGKEKSMRILIRKK